MIQLYLFRISVLLCVCTYPLWEFTEHMLHGGGYAGITCGHSAWAVSVGALAVLLASGCFFAGLVYLHTYLERKARK